MTWKKFFRRTATTLLIIASILSVACGNGNSSQVKNDTQQLAAIKEYNKAIEFNPNDAKAYQLRGNCYKALCDEAKAQADFAKAKELGYNG